ncbi:ATP-binding cassette domain-containing protein [Kitasatospora sp. NPDC059571]|uniref:ATP-binding cassette domain-containing protein n=1 Tax=Kitasatospora sp. NPDC059571 TaxID=3346871 RepID=UPI0036D1108A
MIQVTGLTKIYRRGRAPALLDLTFDARPGTVTALLGDPGAGKTTTLRLMVELERGHGVTLFDGRPYRRLRNPEQHVGVMLQARRPSPGRSDRGLAAISGLIAASGPANSGRSNSGVSNSELAVPDSASARSAAADLARVPARVPAPAGQSAGTTGAAPVLRGRMVGHPGRRAGDHLRMLAAAVGAPPRRADELLEQTRLASVASHRLRTFSPGMHRRLALAAALLGDPAVLLLDAPTGGLSDRGTEWFQAFLRSFAVAGGNVVVTTRSPQEALLLADRIVTLDAGRAAADQSAEDFRRTRFFPEVAVRGPQMARLADVLRAQGAKVRPDGGTGLAVSGIDRTEIGELAYRHGILLHELADRVVEQPAPRPVLPIGSGRSGQVHLRSEDGDGGSDRDETPPPSVIGLPAPAPAADSAAWQGTSEGAGEVDALPDEALPSGTGTAAPLRGPRHRGTLPTVPSLLSGPRPPLVFDRLALGSARPAPAQPGTDSAPPPVRLTKDLTTADLTTADLATADLATADLTTAGRTDAHLAAADLTAADCATAERTMADSRASAAPDTDRTDSGHADTDRTGTDHSATDRTDSGHADTDRTDTDHSATDHSAATADPPGRAWFEPFRGASPTGGWFLDRGRATDARPSAAGPHAHRSQ